MDALSQFEENDAEVTAAFSEQRRDFSAIGAVSSVPHGSQPVLVGWNAQ